MIPVTLTTKGFEQGLPRASLEADLTPQRGDNVTVSLRTDPAEPIAGLKTLLFFKLDTADGLETFLGAWAHLLAVSDDLVDLIHAHPTIADGGPDIQVNMIFPRPGVYRIWDSDPAARNGQHRRVQFAGQTVGPDESSAASQIGGISRQRSPISVAVTSAGDSTMRVPFGK